MFYCAVKSTYIYYIFLGYIIKTKTKQKYNNEAEPTLEFNRSVFMLISALSLKFPDSELG